jgi:monoamine oxidase
VQVHTDAGVFAADAALVTIPLGVLKRPDCMAFQPPLPPRKRAAIRRLGFGCLNKVMLLFPHCFWGDKVRWLCIALMSAARCSCWRVAVG